MTKKRYTFYISEPLAQKFDLVAGRHRRARSALVEEALRALLEPAQYPGIGDTMGRMLDDWHKTIGNIELHRAILSETLAVFLREFLTFTPVMPESEWESARRLGSARYTDLVAEVARRVAGDFDFVAEILAITGPQLPEGVATEPGDGSQNGGNGHEKSSPKGPGRKPKRG
jgi:hypothetical protein